MHNASENMMKGFREFSEHLLFLLNLPREELNVELSPESEKLRFLIDDYQYINPWYTPGYIQFALNNLALATGQIGSLFTIKPVDDKNKTIALLLKPGAPLEGLGEVLICANSGFHCVVSLQEEEISLFRAIINLIGCFVTGIAEKIEIVEGRLPVFDACIGVNSKLNPAVEKYFSKQPFRHISSKGASAILTGKEPAEILAGVAEEICMHFGRSMHSVKSLFVPENYDFGPLMESFGHYNDHLNHSRYYNHYEYRKAVMLINRIQHLDNGFLLVTSDSSQIGFTGVLHYTPCRLPDEVRGSELLKDYPLMVSEQTSGYTIPDKSADAFRRIFGNQDSLSEFLNSI